MEIVIFIAGIAIGLFAMRAYGRRSLAQEPATGSASPIPVETPETQETPQDRLQRFQREADAEDERIRKPSDLSAMAGFGDAVTLLSGDAFTADQVLDHLTGSGYVLPSVAAVALGRRDDIDAAKAVATASQLGAYPLSFLLDYLQTRPDASLLPSLLVHGRDWWWEFAPFRQRLRAYLQWTHAHPFPSAPAKLDDIDDSALAELAQLLKKFQEPALQPFLQQLETAATERREQRVLKEIGRTAFRAPPSPRILHDGLQQQIDRLQEQLAEDGAKPVLVVGEHGVGKSVLIEVLSERLRDRGWLVFEAAASDILAGQKYIGELEGRIREMLAVLNRRRALWRVPDFFDLLAKGSHSRDPRGILDLVLPAIERGELLLIGEITPRQYAQLLLARPGIKHRFEALRIEPASPRVLEDIVARWANAAASRYDREIADQHVLAEAGRLAAHYFVEQHEPGRVLRLLEDALQIATAQEPHDLPLRDDTLIAAVAVRSGLPLDVIDDRQSLDLGRLREFFRKRVIGQDEAVDVLLDRIAMLKAGLVDGKRPIGVFLFAGPTGTGKTELAKALGELLFGSDERLLRLDMSEFQSPDAAQRLLGDGGQESGARSLTSRIREQPFSVVLLDEFEKAHPSAWDLFLQVFDDARLTDSNGNGADFRHSIIILTSNAGATISRGAGLGFVADRGGYSRGNVEKALYEIFRREFINRIDRVVLFNPLDRSLMREILHKELDLVLTRRGFRNRGWAVEWEPSAIEFLLDRGFTPDLGARPLRRAIEHHLLAPLARSIVEHRAPQGDQFLFVRSAGDRLDVEFIDPDAPASAPPTESAHDGPADLRALLFAADDSAAEASILRSSLEALRAQVGGESWTQSRERDYAAMADTGFWSDNGRFAVLDRIERRDRVESALKTAERLHARLEHGSSGAARPVGLVQLLFLLQLAVDDLQEQRPQDALLTVAASQNELIRHPADARQWWQRVLRMYLSWGQRRNMRVQILEQDVEHCRARLAVSGFGALSLLEPEDGLHVLETEDGPDVRRLSLQVQVRPDLPGGSERRKEVAEQNQHVCRRYRDLPSPLVRDTRRGWRSGRLDRVMDGDFDIMQ